MRSMRLITVGLLALCVAGCSVNQQPPVAQVSVPSDSTSKWESTMLAMEGIPAELENTNLAVTRNSRKLQELEEKVESISPEKDLFPDPFLTQAGGEPPPLGVIEAIEEQTDELVSAIDSAKEEILASTVALSASKGESASTAKPFPGADRYLPFTVVKYTADWCGACRSYPDSKIVCELRKLDVDAHREFADSQGVEAYPAFDLYFNGRLVRQFRCKPGQSISAIQPDKINAEIDKILLEGETESSTTEQCLPELPVKAEVDRTYTVTIYRDSGSDSDDLSRRLQEGLPGVLVEEKWERPSFAGQLPYVVLERDGNWVKGYAGGTRASRVRAAISCYKGTPQVVATSGGTVSGGAPYRSASRQKWSVNGNWNPSWQTLIDHLSTDWNHTQARTGYSREELTTFTRSQLIALHDDDHDSRRGR